MTDCARIIAARIWDEERGVLERTDYHWEGAEDVAYMDVRGLHLPQPVRPGTVFTLGALRLRAVDLVYPDSRTALLVMRDGWRARLYALYYPLLRRLKTVPARVEMTLAVWGLRKWPTRY